MMEAAMEFGASQDMSAVLAVQIRRRLGLGIWTSFHISNVHLEGKVKIGVKFVDGWPVIGRIRLCFTTAPFLQMTARPLFNAGVDVTEIPGIAQWLVHLLVCTVPVPCKIETR
jgi:Ca2+-dependent lipid-binding protein